MASKPNRMDDATRPDQGLPERTQDGGWLVCQKHTMGGWRFDQELQGGQENETWSWAVGAVNGAVHERGAGGAYRLQIGQPVQPYGGVDNEVVLLVAMQASELSQHRMKNGVPA